MKFAARGTVWLEQWRGGILIAEREFANGVTNVGMNKLLDSLFNGATPGSNWFIGFIDEENFVSLSPNDTLNGHSGWLEWTGSPRIAWAKDSAASAASLTNSTPATVTIPVVGTIAGIFVCNTETDNTGLLWATALMTSPLDVVNGDALKLSYRVSLSGSQGVISVAAENAILDGLFNGVSTGTSWYVGLVSTPTTAPLPNETMATRAWLDFPLAANRLAYGQGVASGQRVDSANPITFTLGTIPTDPSYGAHPELIWGIFVTNHSTLNDNTGLFLCANAFSSPITAQSGYTLRVTHEFTF